MLVSCMHDPFRTMPNSVFIAAYQLQLNGQQRTEKLMYIKED
jgi:hypothetical protein